jgi:hypothetical protein
MRVVRNRSFWGVGGGLTEENLFSDKKNYVIYFSLDKKNQGSFKFCTQKKYIIYFFESFRFVTFFWKIGAKSKQKQNPHP